MSVASVKAVPKAPMEVAKQSAPVEKSAGVRAGIVTSLRIRQEEAPSVRAASS